jgi:hypothetical protein
VTGGFGQAGLFQERHVHRFFHLILEFIEAARLAGLGVLNGVTTLGNRDDVAGAEHSFQNAQAIHLGPVGAVQIADEPEAFLEGQFAMFAGHVGKLQANVT